MLNKILPIYFYDKEEIKDFETFELINVNMYNFDNLNDKFLKISYSKEENEYIIENITSIEFILKKDGQYWKDVKENILIINIKKIISIYPYKEENIPTVSYILNDDEYIPLKEIK